MRAARLLSGDRAIERSGDGAMGRWGDGAMGRKIARPSSTSSTCSTCSTSPSPGSNAPPCNVQANARFPLIPCFSLIFHLQLNCITSGIYVESRARFQIAHKPISPYVHTSIRPYAALAGHQKQLRLSIRHPSLPFFDSPCYFPCVMIP